MERKFLVVSAFLGIVLGRLLTAFREGLRAGTKSSPGHAAVMVNILAQQNTLLMNHVISLQNKFVGELISITNSDDSTESSVHEISCRSDHIEMVQSLMDDASESVVKETAMWAHGVLRNYNLSLKSVSLETEYSVEPGRERDIVLVFHVKGVGDDALRFQGEATRKLRDIASRNNAPSVKILRTEVRWS
jgi:hypothetical protein